MFPDAIRGLNARYAIADHVQFAADPGGLPVASVRNAHATAQIALNGGNVIGFQPQGHVPVLWLSRHSVYQLGKAIRGGIPVCWPWFGPHPTDARKPSHGFARTVLWTPLGTAARPDGATEVRLGLRDSQATRALWPHAFALQLAVVVGPALQVTLSAQNTGREAWLCGGALHSYFAVGDVTAIRIHGLDGCTYVDKTDAMRSMVQRGPLVIGGETDRVYQHTAAPVEIEDPLMQRRITLAKAGSRSTVVWNPWRDGARALKDFGAEEYGGMVCVETANALDDGVCVKPGGEHRLQAVIQVTPQPA